MWCGIVAYVVLASRHSDAERSKITVLSVHAEVVDADQFGLITESKLSQWLAEGGGDFVGRTLGEVDTRAIERQLEGHDEVRQARVWVNLDGVLSVEVAQRQPIMRVWSSNGYRFWMTADNYILPDVGEFTARVPVVTGEIPFPFGVTETGSYDAIVQGVWDDFVDQFTKIEGERRRLVAQKREEQAEISEIRAKRAGYFWSKARKEIFAEGKKQQIAPHEQKIAELDAAMKTLAERKNTLRVKEKKSQQTHAFLTKLTNFVKLVEGDRFWAGQIVQINVPAEGEGVLQEPVLELIPRVGDYTILLGVLDGREAEKLGKLRTFYTEALPREGWSSARHIDIRYDNQIVCTK
jgi:cell division protein FtsQ